MSGIRTDLAEESAALSGAGEDSGLLRREREREGCRVTELRIVTESAARRLGKPAGRYITVELPCGEDGERAGACAVAAELRELLQDCRGDVLVAGLGNRTITPDAIGPWTVENVLVTRHLQSELPDCFRSVAAVATGVLGTTGVESGELMDGIAERVRPGVVIAVDALAARSADRLCSAVQLSDAGIVPGSGVGNARKALDRHTLGVPVISVGIPTVVDAATLAEDLTGAPAERSAQGLIVTPRDIDRQAMSAAHLIAVALNLALHGLSYEETLELMA